MTRPPEPALVWKTPLAAAVFDLDGTLIDSLPLTFQAFRAALSPCLGREPTDAEIYARFGPADHEIVSTWAGARESREAVARLMAAYAQGAETVLRYDGVDAMLATLKRLGLRLALCTGRGRPSTELILARLGMERLFETIVTGEDVACPKPAPDGVLHTARLLKLAPESILYTGDSIKDVDAGIAAGTFTVAALWAGTEVETPEFSRAHARAREPGDIAGLVTALRS